MIFEYSSIACIWVSERTSFHASHFASLTAPCLPIVCSGGGGSTGAGPRACEKSAYSRSFCDCVNMSG